MKRFLLAVAIAMSLGCAGKNIVVEAPEIEEAPAVNTDKTLQLIGRGGIAQGCPVEGIIYTAAHVVQYEKEDGTPTAFLPGYAFSTDDGNRGFVVTAMVGAFRDIAVLYVREGEVNYYKLGSTPESGDRVYWREYDFESDVMDKALVSADVTLILAGHVVMNDYPEQGASGGCLFNEDGEVVGVVTWSILGYGVAVLITGFWGL